DAFVADELQPPDCVAIRFCFANYGSLIRSRLSTSETSIFKSTCGSTIGLKLESPVTYRWISEQANDEELAHHLCVLLTARARRVQRHGRANKSLQCLLVNLLAIAKINRAPGVA